MKLTFMGATGTVTGSKYLLTDGSNKILVDCGLFQGYKELRLRNWGELPVDPHTIDAVVLTHAHIDHSGYLPLLVKHGFKGKIYCTPATKDLCSILLPDSGYLQEEEARLANKFHSSKHKPALPLYTKEDAIRSLKHFSVVDFDTPLKLLKTFTIRFHRAGHILGASLVSVKHHSISLLFSGDLGRPHDPVMRAPDIISETDYLVLESTYGDRLHASDDPQEKLGEIIRETAKRGGSVIIPAFAVGRAQTLLYYIYKLKLADKIPYMPIFLDSPMAEDATDLLCRYKNEHRQSEEECNKFCSVATYVKTLDESQEVDNLKIPSIIISASGMATGGRVLHHLKALAPNYRNTILFTGYQAGGTRGDRILKGEREIKIFGEMIPVKAQVESISNLSAHADYQEILDWLCNFKNNPRKVFITHGEPEAALSLKKKIEEKFGWDCVVPHYLQKENLS
ncbi:MAG: MBL fold metallo-hydrolase RNA specificity domain-containing protein [Gammaproteobacteria bacterium]